MIEDTALIARYSARTTVVDAPLNLCVNLQITYRLFLNSQAFAKPEISETEAVRARASIHETRGEQNLKKITGPAKCSAWRTVENQLALAVAKRGLWAIVGMIILKVMTLCEGIAGTVDFAQMLMQNLDFWRGF